MQSIDCARMSLIEMLKAVTKVRFIEETPFNLYNLEQELNYIHQLRFNSYLWLTIALVI